MDIRDYSILLIDINPSKGTVFLLLFYTSQSHTTKMSVNLSVACQLSVKLSVACQLSVKLSVACQLSVKLSVACQLSNTSVDKDYIWASLFFT